MPKQYSVRLVIRVLRSKGFFFVSQKGSHAKYRKVGKLVLTVIIPKHEKDLRYGTFKSILEQAQLKESDFNKRK
ncbi:MAG: hypothetical protein CMI52_05085 [Parcubacteria group bacterium]|nr:hypothetical protein [Parcubacteria group bacterium]|tara:strand:- start:131 stop:352 length:222 start_codon:yes stop_codon:yes gene_type:complete